MLSARRALHLLLLLPLLLIACGAPATAAHAAPGAPLPTSVAVVPPPLPAATTDPSPVPSIATAATPPASPPPAPPAPPDPHFVGFSGLAPGSYPVHLHRVCSGLQGYHLAYLPNLAVSMAGSGGIAVPAGDFGRGWCLVVYANPAQTSVAAYRPI